LRRRSGGQRRERGRRSAERSKSNGGDLPLDLEGELVDLVLRYLLR
jgi:hypothetical protein